MKTTRTILLLMITLLFIVRCSNDSENNPIIDTQCIEGQILNIPDANFKAKLLEASTSNLIAQNPGGERMKIDENNDGEIQYCEAEKVGNLTVSNSQISTVEGISAFKNLEGIQCQGNNLEALDLSNSSKLVLIFCNNNNLKTLDVSNLTALKTLYFYYNQLTTLNLNCLLYTSRCV